MTENRVVPDGMRSFLTEIGITLLTVVVILVISASYRNFGDHFTCNGGLGAGFPVSFLCDYGTGGSPIDSWGKIDLSDFPYFSAQGLLIDVLFYTVILAIGGFLRRVLRRDDSDPVPRNIWLVLVGVAFVLGFVSAAMTYKSERINFHDYILGIPTSVPATPTPFGTQPPPLTTPVPTSGP